MGGRKVLRIRWQRLLDDADRTCDRCGATGAAVEDAVGMLKRSLAELGIEVVLQKEALDRATFSRDPLQSNRIWIAGRPIEEWLAATSGKSPCCSACGDAECRTVTVGGKTHEAIPVALIVQAGLLAGARMLDAGAMDQCCDSAENPETGPGRSLPSAPCECS